MRYFSSFDEEQQPVTTWQGYPIYAAHLIVGALVGSLFFSTAMLAFKQTGALDTLAFASPEVWRGQLWRVFSYGLVNPPSLGFVIDVFMLAMFGREVEKALGRTSFLRLYACIYFIPPLLLTCFGAVTPMYRAGHTGALAVFIAFATYYPDAGMMFNLLAKWAAAILISIFTLVALANHNWSELISIWATCGFAFVFVRHAKGEWEIPALFRRGSAPSAMRRADPGTSNRSPGKPITGDSSAPRKAAPVDSLAEVDALLDKIAVHGMQSLTKAERARLDAAQARLAKRRDATR